MLSSIQKNNDIKLCIYLNFINKLLTSSQKVPLDTVHLTLIFNQSRDKDNLWIKNEHAGVGNDRHRTQIQSSSSFLFFCFLEVFLLSFFAWPSLGKHHSQIYFVLECWATKDVILDFHGCSKILVHKENKSTLLRLSIRWSPFSLLTKFKANYSFRNHLWTFFQPVYYVWKLSGENESWISI